MMPVDTDDSLSTHLAPGGLIFGIALEQAHGEARVAGTPTSIKQLIKLGYQVQVQSGAGMRAGFSDRSYVEAGAEIVDSRELWSQSNIVARVREPQSERTGDEPGFELLKPGSVLISFIWPARNPSLMQALRDQELSVFAMDCVPRISRAQKLDALSSMANIGGYRAVIEAAQYFGRFFTGQITAAGKVPPAKVLVIGAGVAGLAAIGTAVSLGAIVRAFDTRPEVKEQIESMGAEFLELDFKEDGSGQGGYAKVMSPEFIAAEMALFAEQAKDIDIIITTALIPGKPAPELITREMVQTMRSGSVIVDLAAEQGGNCKLTEPGTVVRKHDVTIIGYTDLPGRMATQSSELYASNVAHFLDELTPHRDGQLVIDRGDDVIRGTLVTQGGEITWPPSPPVAMPTPKPPAEPVSAAASQPVPANKRQKGMWVTMLLGGLALWGVGQYAPAEFMPHLTVFVLACFVGYQVIWNVTPALHTPLMSVTNAISGIIVVGALLQISSTSMVVAALATISVLIATVNITGGFLVTHRMLNMFKKD